jgi:hypothetical protein
MEWILLALFSVCDPSTGICTPDPAPPVPHVAVPTAQPQRSILVRRVILLPRLREAQPARKLVGASFRVVRYGLKGGAKLIAAPFRAARVAHCNSLARRANRGNQVAAVRLGRCK